jgi:hypothetical protein
MVATYRNKFLFTEKKLHLLNKFFFPDLSCPLNAYQTPFLFAAWFPNSFDLTHTQNHENLLKTVNTVKITRIHLKPLIKRSSIRSSLPV